MQRFEEVVLGRGTDLYCLVLGEVLSSAPEAQWDFVLSQNKTLIRELSGRVSSRHPTSDLATFSKLRPELQFVLLLQALTVPGEEGHEVVANSWTLQELDRAGQALSLGQDFVLPTHLLDSVSHLLGTTKARQYFTARPTSPTLLALSELGRDYSLLTFVLDCNSGNELQNRPVVQAFL